MSFFLPVTVTLWCHCAADPHQGGEAERDPCSQPSSLVLCASGPPEIQTPITPPHHHHCEGLMPQPGKQERLKSSVLCGEKKIHTNIKNVCYHSSECYTPWTIWYMVATFCLKQAAQSLFCMLTLCYESCNPDSECGWRPAHSVAVPCAACDFTCTIKAVQYS